MSGPIRRILAERLRSQRGEELSPFYDVSRVDYHSDRYEVVIVIEGRPETRISPIEKVIVNPEYSGPGFRTEMSKALAVVFCTPRATVYVDKVKYTVWIEPG